MINCLGREYCPSSPRLETVQLSYDYLDLLGGMKYCMKLAVTNDSSPGADSFIPLTARRSGLIVASPALSVFRWMDSKHGLSPPWILVSPKAGCP